MKHAGSSPTATCKRRPPIPSDRRSAFRVSLLLARFPALPPARVNKLYEIADSISHQTGAHALRAGVNFLYNDCLITYPRSIRGSYAFSSLANFQQGIYNNAGFTQTFGNSVVAQTNPNIGFYAQDEWKVNPRLTLEPGRALRPAVPENHRHRHEQRLAARRFRLVSVCIQAHRGSRQLWAVLRPRSSARAGECPLVGGNTTTINSSSQISVSLSPTQTGAPVFPNILPSTGLPAGVLVNFTTMNPNMQNAYSEQGSFEIEQQLGRAQHLERRLPASARTSSDRLRQSERANLRGVGQQQRMPPEPELREQQPVFPLWRIPTMTACTSPSCSGPCDGEVTASPTPTRSLWTMWASSSSARRSTPTTSGRITDDPTTTSGIASSSMAPSIPRWGRQKPLGSVSATAFS